MPFFPRFALKRWSVVLLILFLMTSTSQRPTRAEDPDSLDEKPNKGGAANVVAGSKQGRYSFELVTAAGKPIEPLRFVRGIPGQFSISEFPRPFVLEGHTMFEAGRRLDAQLSAGGVTVFCEAPATADGEAARYASQCSANLPTGKYGIDPFGLTFEVGQGIRSTHPALTVQGNAVRIRTAPVTFQAVDATTGVQVPLDGLALFCGKANLLKDLLDTTAAVGFNPLTLYLPVGTTYQSSLGDFTIDDGGVVRPSPNAGVSFNAGAFVTKIKKNAAVVVAAPVGKGYWLASQNLRRVYKRGEIAPFVVIASGEYVAGNLAIVAKSREIQTPLGNIAMPTVSGTDSRLFLLDTGALAPGKYELSANAADAHPFGIEIVDLLERSPLFLFTVNACGESDFTVDSAGLDQLRDTGVRCWTSYGFGGGLDPKGEGKVPYPAPAADAPPELKRPVSDARALLDDCLRHGLITIDFENRRAGWYNEGLAYHHTHPMSVDRMIRRVQIFGQELGDYPAFAGMSYTWFPALGGYAEGGVPNDPFFGTRMELLHEKVKQQTGFTLLTQAQWQEWQNDTRTGAAIPQALVDRRRNEWRAEQHIGFYDSFDLYNHKLREVRPDFITTTACNAGHDEGINVADMAGAHDAMTWESYTDFGDWPMSAGFCADWGHGEAPGKPQWQQVEPSQAEPAILAKQMYKLARGVEGIGVGVHGPSGARSNARRGKSNKFLERYGSLVTGYQPDMTVAVCVNEMQDRYEYNAHALHSHLTRLGYGPVILSEQTIEKGVPAGVKVIFIPNFQISFSPECQKGFGDFQSRGGKIVLVGEHLAPMAGAIRVEIPLKQLWDFGGFGEHLAFWNEFKKVRPALEKTMAELGLSPANGASPEKAVILPMRSAGVRYVAVIASSLEKRDTEFSPAQGVVVKVGSPAQIVNLVTGQTLKATDGNVSVDLVNEPVALLALLDGVPTGVSLHYPSQITAGEQIELSAQLKPAGGDVRVPMQYVMTDSAGKERAVFYRLSGPGQQVKYAVSSTEPAGNYSVTATELLTGLTTKAAVKINPPAGIAAVAIAPSVYLPHPDRIPLFLSRKGEVRVVVEDTQSQDAVDAERIVAALKKSGRPAVIEKIDPGSYDGLKLRWYPTHHDDEIVAKIDAGEVVGYRLDMKSYINAATRTHIPEKGGWADIKPSYVVRNDVILFSGGRLAESLRAVSDWMQSPSAPGKGAGTIEVALSPFWADRQAIAIVSNDAAGRTQSVNRLIELIESGGKVAPASPFAPPAVAVASLEATGADRTAIETPLKGFVPPALVDGIVATADGYAAVQTHNATQLVTPEGKIARTLAPAGLPILLAEGGVYFGGAIDLTHIDPGWHFATAWKIAVHIADAKGASSSLNIPGEVDWIGDHFRGWDGGYAVSDDGKTYFAGEANGGFILFDLPSKTYRNFPYDPRAMRYYEASRAQLFVSAARFSTDGQFVAFTLAHHPSGYGGMGSPPISPYSAEIRVIRVSTGEVVWKHEAPNLRDDRYSAADDSLAIGDGANRVAIITFDQEAVLFDQTGKELIRKPVFDWKKRYGVSDGRTNKPPLRVQMTRDGSSILFASGDVVRLTDGAGTTLAELNSPLMSDARMSADGSHIHIADPDGAVSCFDRKGSLLWSVQTEGTGPKLAETAQGVFVAEGAANLLLIDNGGKELRRTPLAGAITAPPVEPAWNDLNVSGPAIYREPQTLATLQKYGAKQVAIWTPATTAHDAFGHKFYPADKTITLGATGNESHVVHLVYRHRAAEGQGPTATLSAGGKSRTFTLDLPTPEYRVVDLPCEEKRDLTVTITPAPQLEVAELSIYTLNFPGANTVFVKPAGTALEHVAGLDLTGEKKPKPDEAEILDDKDPTQAAKAAAGKMKNTGIFAGNPDPDQVEGHYLRATGNALDNFDGRRFLDGKPSAWSRGEKATWGSRLLIDLNHLARPKLCALYERTLRQSEVMRAIVVLRGEKADFILGEAAGPDKLGSQPRGIAGFGDNDQFFNVIDTAGVEMDALGVYTFSGRGKDHGLSEVELYE